MQRPLDTGELSFYAASRRILTNCAVVAHLDRAPDPDLLRRALDRVQARHPLLRVRVEHGEIPRLRDDDVPPIPLAIAPRHDQDTWLWHVNHELNAPFSFARGPLCRFVLVRGEAASDLLLIFNHVIADGLSGGVIVRDVMTALRDPERPPAPLPERPPLTEQLSALGLPLPGFGLVGRLIDRAADSLAVATHAFTPDAGAPPHPPVGVLHHAASLTLDEAATSRILADCRAADTTVFGFVAATLLTTIARQRRAAARVSMAAPISIRSLFTPPLDAEVGLYSYAPWLPVSVDLDEPLWPLARRLVSKVQWIRRLFLPRAAGLSMRALRPWISGLADSPLAAALSRSFDAEVVASNIGRIADIAPAAGVRVTGVSKFAIVPGVDLALISQSYAGRMTINFVHTTPSPRPGLPERIEIAVFAGLGRDDARGD